MSHFVLPPYCCAYFYRVALVVLVTSSAVSHALATEEDRVLSTDLPMTDKELAHVVAADVSHDPQITLQIVEKAISEHPASVASVVGAAIEASTTDPSLIKQIVLTAITHSDESEQSIIEAAILAAPEQAKRVRAAYVESTKSLSHKVPPILQGPVNYRVPETTPWQLDVKPRTAPITFKPKAKRGTLSELFGGPMVAQIGGLHFVPPSREIDAMAMMGTAIPARLSQPSHPVSIQNPASENPEKSASPAKERFVSTSFRPVLRSVPMSPTSP